MPDSATLSIRDAIANAITQGTNPPSGPSGPILGSPRFYLDRAPANAPLGYFILGAVSEDEAGFLNGQLGQAGTQRIHCWADTVANALRMYRWLKALIHNQRLFLDGHTMVSGTLRVITTQPDPDRLAHQVVADYTTETLEG